MNATDIIGKLTGEETADLASECLTHLSEETALEVIKRWAKANGMSEELGFDD